MTQHRNSGRLILALATVSALALAGQVQAQSTAAAPAAPAPAAEIHNDVDPITIIGKRMPDAYAPKSATCEYLVANDPMFRAQILYSGGNPLMGPTIYLPTRLPRNPDYSAAPLSPPGSAIPVVSSRWKNATGWASDGEKTATAGENGGASDIAAERDACFKAASTASGGPSSLAAQLDVAQGPRHADPRWEIARRDTTLMTGFALFDDGRYPEALEWFKKAAQKLTDNDGGDEAALMIGKIYLQGLGPKSDTAQALVWLKKAAGAPFNATTSMPVFDPKEPDRNTAIGEACVILGNVHLTGAFGVSKNPAEARKWFERAAYVGHVSATKTLGDLYLYGRETPRDASKAFSYYKKAATLNHAGAQVALADLYYRGEGVAQDLKTSLNWYREAARIEHPVALYSLALAYDTGEGVAANPQLALGFYKIAALNGHVGAQTALGTYFYEGKLLPKDHKLARHWFEAAAIQGQPDAMFNLAAMTLKGEGGEKDAAKAWVWLRLAQIRGHQSAPVALAALERRMSAAEKQAGAELLEGRKKG